MLSDMFMDRQYYKEHYNDLKGTKEGNQIESKIKRCERYNKECVGEYMKFITMTRSYPNVIVYTTDFQRDERIEDMIAGAKIIGFSPFYPDDEMDAELERKYGDVLKIPTIW